MNYVDAIVVEVLSSLPEYKYDKYWVEVEYISMGVSSKTKLMFDKEIDALNVKKGYKFLV